MHMESKGMSHQHCGTSPSKASQTAYPATHGNEAHQNPLIHLNSKIQRDAVSTLLNESYLEALLDELQGLPRFSHAIYGLTLTRINELALICAGNYADSCEYTAVGDLMVNPAQVLVHLRGKTHPVLKDRHEKLTTQFKDAAKEEPSLIQWFIKNTIVEIRKKPILMQLHAMLIESEIISKYYIASADRRMKQIADTMGCLSAWKVASVEDFHQKLKTAGPSERAFIQKALCRFDMGLFDEMEKDIFGFLRDDHYRSRFIDM